MVDLQLGRLQTTSLDLQVEGGLATGVKTKQHPPGLQARVDLQLGRHKSLVVGRGSNCNYYETRTKKHPHPKLLVEGGLATRATTKLHPPELRVHG